MFVAALHIKIGYALGLVVVDALHTDVTILIVELGCGDLTIGEHDVPHVERLAVEKQIAVLPERHVARIPANRMRNYPVVLTSQSDRHIRLELRIETVASEIRRELFEVRRAQFVLLPRRRWRRVLPDGDGRERQSRRDCERDERFLFPGDRRGDFRLLQDGIEAFADIRAARHRDADRGRLRAAGDFD